MTTEDLDKLAINHEEHFIYWARYNHGDHKGLEGGCEVADELEKYDTGNSTVQKVLDAVKETEGNDWYESWTNFLQDKDII